MKNTLTHEEEKVSNIKALIYGYGNLMGLGSNLIVQWLLYYYCPPQDSNLKVLAPMMIMGVVILLGRVVDAVSDPLIGYWSDKTVTRWGRRRPFIVFGFILMALSQILIWIPIVQGESVWNAVYAAIHLGLFWFGFTAAIAPYLALLPEIARSTHERVKLSAFQAFFGQVSLIIGGVVVPILLSAIGFLSTSIVLTIIAASSMLAVVLGIKERRITDEKIAKQLNILDAVRFTITNKIFLIYLVPTALLVLSTTAVQMVIPYAVKVSARLSEGDVALFYFPLILFSMLSLPLFNRLTARYGKKKMYLLGMSLFIIPATLLAFIGKVGLNPRIFLMVTGSISGVIVTPLLMLPNAFIADITDVDEKITGYRREAIYFGVQGLITKSMAGLAGVLTSILLESFGYSIGNDLGIRLSFALSGIILIPAAIVFLRYPLER